MNEMYLELSGKLSKGEILSPDNRGKLISLNKAKDSHNMLVSGENLNVLKCLLFDYNLKDRVDLVYIDPPFSTNNTFKIGDTRANTISASLSDETAYSDLLKGSMFIEFLRERLILLKELMSQKASIYLHIDYKIGHYVKVMMDEIFGIKNFRNDITRIKCSPKNFGRKAYGNIKDLVLFYTKTNSYTWNDPKSSLGEDDIGRLFKKVNKNGRKYTTVPLHAPGETKNGPTGQAWRGEMPPKGRHWRSEPKVLEQLDKQGLIEWSSNGVPRKIIYADDARKNGKKLQDIWEFKDPMYPTYPTEKNRELLKLIIETSSNQGDLILDCFVGSGTTVLVANELQRDWIGIDQSESAIKVMKNRLAHVEKTLFKSTPQYHLMKLTE